MSAGRHDMRMNKMSNSACLGTEVFHIVISETHTEDFDSNKSFQMKRWYPHGEVIRNKGLSAKDA